MDPPQTLYNLRKRKKTRCQEAIQDILKEESREATGLQRSREATGLQRSREATGLQSSQSKRRKITLEPIVDLPSESESEEYSGNKRDLEGSSESEGHSTNGSESEEYSDSESETEPEGHSTSSDSDSEGSSEDPDGDFIDDSESESEYFKLDPTPLINVILKKLTKLFPELPKEELHKAVRKSLERAQDDILNEYCGTIPRDERWKTEVEEEDIEKLEPQLKAVREMINKERPTLKKILEANIMSSDRKTALQIYDIMENTEPYTYDHLEAQECISRILKETDDPEKLKKYEEEEERLKKKVGDSLSRLKRKIFDLNASEEVKTRIYELYLQMEDLRPGSDERASLRQKITWAVSLPHQNVVLPEVRLQGASLEEKAKYCRQAYDRLDSKLYGMKPVKERLIQILNNRLSNPKSRSTLALEGPAGVGKTAVARALAKSVGLPFEKVSLGGLEDPSMLTGQDNSWVGSTPSILLQILKRMKCCNGVVLFDEIDKLSDSPRGKDIQNVLLHVFFFFQNKEFQDSYLYEFPHDLSQIWFMCAMNDSKLLDPILRDRMDIITLEKYRQVEMVPIIQLYILPGVLKDIGLVKDSITISEQACNTVLSLLSPQMKTSGLRAVEKELHRMVSRIHFFHTNQHSGNKIKLSYKLPEFRGFPHQITGSEIHDLWSDPKVNLDYLRIYG